MNVHVKHINSELKNLGDVMGKFSVAVFL